MTAKSCRSDGGSMDNKKIIGQRINSALALSGKMQKDLAAVLGVTDNTVSYYVGGKRSPSTEQLIEIAKYLGVTSDYLLGIDSLNAHNINYSRDVFPERLKFLREKCGMSCAALAEKIGVTGASIGYYERGERTPNIEILQSLCKTFEVSADYLLGISDVMIADISICNRIFRKAKIDTAVAVDLCVDEMRKLADKLRRNP